MTEKTTASQAAMSEKEQGGALQDAQEDASRPRVVGTTDPELLEKARKWANARANSGEACLN